MPSIRSFIMGGSKVIKKHADALAKYLPNGQIIFGYGTTENGGSVISASEGNADNVGQLYHNMQVKVKFEYNFLSIDNCINLNLNRFMERMKAYWGPTELVKLLTKDLDK